MSRTTHHTPPDQRLFERLGMSRRRFFWPPVAPAPVADAYPGAPTRAARAETFHETATLRYPASELAVTDRRPVPQLVRRRHVSYSYTRTWHGADIDESCAYRERSARAAQRQALTAATATANTLLRSAEWGDGEWDDVAEFDITPTQHRNSAFWDAC